jgi:hypothetical protein
MGRAVLLEHLGSPADGDRPAGPGDGAPHFDWMIERPETVRGGQKGRDAQEHCGVLITFRVRERIDLGLVRRFRAERIGEHRAAYLEFEGELTGGRGRVRRLARGELNIEEDSTGAFACRGWLGSARGTFMGRRGGSGWEFEFRPG